MFKADLLDYGFYYKKLYDSPTTGESSHETDTDVEKKITEPSVT